MNEMICIWAETIIILNCFAWDCENIDIIIIRSILVVLCGEFGMKLSWINCVLILVHKTSISGVYSNT